ERMLCFSVNGVFKEVEGQSQGSVLAFTRTFITTPGSSSRLVLCCGQEHPSQLGASVVGMWWVQSSGFSQYCGMATGTPARKRLRVLSPSQCPHSPPALSPPSPRSTGNGAGFLCPVWDETRVVSE
ncbi:hypothetical protein H8959_000795, partial [Pygathrix nigripes]